MLIDAVWPQIAISNSGVLKNEETLQTPDSGGKPFSVVKKTVDSVTIQTDGNNTVSVGKESFRSVLEYLILHNNVSRVQYCKIGASRDNPGPLDLASRIPQSKSSTLVIIYILPILAAAGIVKIDGGRPNKVWLNL